MTNILGSLNQEQREVVLATHGPVLVLAGAGSGKTRALTHRIAYLIETGAARPDEILAVTFTNKAAREMKERVRRLLPSRQKTPAALGTFHSIGARMVREHAGALGRSRGFTILDEQDSLRLAKQATERVGVGRAYSPGSLRAMISRAKNEGSLPQEEMAAAVYQEYQRLLAAHDACDFDDLLVLPAELLAREPRIRSQYQERWRFLSVDEYQDTNALQVRFLELLLGEQRNICVVGDDYQAIYSWRGARVDHIRQFAQQFSGCRVLTLTQNYRSTPHVLTAANAVMLEGNGLETRELWTARLAQGKPVQLVQLPSDRREVQFVREQIEAQVRSGGKLSDCAVLYRTNAQSRLFEEEFLRREIPYTIVGGFRFYERREVKDALALLQLAQNGQAGLAAGRVAAALWRGIGPKTIAGWQARAEQAGISLRDELYSQAQQRPALAGVMQALARGQKKQFATAGEELRFLLTASGYMTYLSRLPDQEERNENIEELLNVASVYSSREEFLEPISKMVKLVF